MMKYAYKKRPGDFKRRIIGKRVNTKFELLDEEHRWLSMIPKEDLGGRYYNLTNHRNGNWTSDPEKFKTVVAKISKSMIGVNVGRKHTESAKEKMRLRWLGTKRDDATKRKMADSARCRISINNGVVERRILKSEQIPDGWVIGRIRNGRTRQGKGVGSSQGTLQRNDSHPG